MVQQVVHGTRYIDEAVLEILEDGLVWVHQDANWNVLALTDFAGRALERYDQTPYGIVTVDQESYFGDYDGDSLVTLAEVDSNTNGSLGVGDACWGSNPSGACRVLDFDFDEDVDAADKTVFDALVSADTYRRPGRTTSALGHTRFHQGLILDPEIGSFNNRNRQYAPMLRRFVQRDPLAVHPRGRSGYQDGLNLYICSGGNPVARLDPSGSAVDPCATANDPGGLCETMKSTFNPDGAAYAVTICCGNRPITCWYSHADDYPQPGFHACNQEHESIHRDCCRCDRCTDWRCNTTDQEKVQCECDAYGWELLCLEQKQVEDCGRLSGTDRVACEQAYNCRIASRCHWAREWCNRAGGGGPGPCPDTPAYCD